MNILFLEIHPFKGLHLKIEFFERLRDFFLTTVTTVTAVTTVTFFSCFKTFSVLWKELFDTFDNRCDVLRAAFCDSRNVFC